MKFRWLLFGLTSLAIGQVGWWSYLLISKQDQLVQLHATVSDSGGAKSSAAGSATESADRFRFMIVTEGLFFCLVLSLGMIYAYRAHLQRLNLQKTQSDFLSAVTHELKTPIANIQLSLDSLERVGAIKIDGASKYWDRAQRACDRLLSQVDRILSLASDEEAPLVIEKVQWSSLAEVLRGQFEHQASKIHWPTNPPVESFSASIEGVRLVLGCLIDNALKYGQAGWKSGGQSGGQSQVTIELETSPRGLGEWVYIHVIDQGPGLSAEELERIFDPFWRGGKAAATGTGLGLALSLRMSKRMGGDLSVQPAGTGAGLKFTLKLPKVAA